jgi:hypothetical protein
MYQSNTTATRCGTPIPYLIMAQSTLQGVLARSAHLLQRRAYVTSLAADYR